jgi:predicted ribosomally synthesized peptide with nif11-like leader
MSKDNVKMMFAKMAKDEVFHKRYTDLMQAHQQETEKILADKLIQLGKTAGFEFSNEDLLAARAEVMDMANSNKELSDNDLERVAGGGLQKAAVILASISTIGIACGIVSAIAEASKSGKCAAGLSITEKC